jgi:5-methylcytosine-specific restriction endonuclease McrA
MTGILPKHPRLRLDPFLYKKLCRQVLARDNWRCQVCGSKDNLQVHHQHLRSQQGSDEDSNLITLCAECHAQLHGSRSEIIGQRDDKKGPMQ